MDSQPGKIQGENRGKIMVPGRSRWTLHTECLDVRCCEPVSMRYTGHTTVRGSMNAAKREGPVCGSG